MHPSSRCASALSDAYAQASGAQQCTTYLDMPIHTNAVQHTALSKVRDSPPSASPPPSIHAIRPLLSAPAAARAFIPRRPCHALEPNLHSLKPAGGFHLEENSRPRSAGAGRRLKRMPAAKNGREVTRQRGRELGGRRRWGREAENGSRDNRAKGEQPRRGE